MNKEVIGYYQSNIKTSRNEDSVYAIKYASQQMLIDKLKQENKELHNKIDKAIEYINWWVDDNKKLEIGLTISETDGLLKILKDSDVDE